MKSFKEYLEEAEEKRKFVTPDPTPIQHPKVGDAVVASISNHSLTTGKIHKIEGDHIHITSHMGNRQSVHHKSKVFSTKNGSVTDAWPMSKEVK